MPIEKRHDPSAGMLALAGFMTGRGAAAVSELEAEREAGQIAVQLDAQQTIQTQQLSAQRASQMEQINAQADRQREAADTAYARTALAAGLQGKIQEQQFDNEMEKLQEEAKIEANQWEYEFTIKQRQEIARLNEADELVMNDPSYSESDREEWRFIKAQKLAGITPRARPADPNKPIYPEGMGPGILTKEEDGSTTTIDKDGQKKLIQRFDQSPEHFEEQREQALKLKRMELEVKQAEAKQKFMLDMAMEQIPVIQPARKGGLLGKDTPAGPTGEMRFRTAEELRVLEARHDAITGQGEGVVGPEVGPTNEQLEQEPQQEGYEIPWWIAPQEQGMNVTEEMRQAPPEIGQAMLYIQEAEKKYRNVSDIPAGVLEQLMEADRRVKEHRSGGT